MNRGIDFIQEELQLLCAACVNYGKKFMEIVESIPNEEEDILDRLSDRAKDSWRLAVKIADNLPG